MPASLIVTSTLPLSSSRGSVLDLNYIFFSRVIIKIKEQEGVYILSRRHATGLGSNFLTNFGPSIFPTFVEIWRFMCLTAMKSLILLHLFRQEEWLSSIVAAHSFPSFLFSSSHVLWMKQNHWLLMEMSLILEDTHNDSPEKQVRLCHFLSSKVFVWAGAYSEHWTNTVRHFLQDFIFFQTQRTDSDNLIRSIWIHNPALLTVRNCRVFV